MIEIKRHTETVPLCSGQPYPPPRYVSLPPSLSPLSLSLLCACRITTVTSLPIMGSLLSKVRKQQQPNPQDHQQENGVVEDEPVIQVKNDEEIKVQPDKFPPDQSKEQPSPQDHHPTSNGHDVNGSEAVFLVPEPFNDHTTYAETVEVDTSSETSSVDTVSSKRKSEVVEDEHSPKKSKTETNQPETPLTPAQIISLHGSLSPDKLFVFEELQLPCDLCKKDFPTEAERICHKPCFYERLGEKEEPYSWRCQFDKCNRSFANIFHLKQHVSTHYDGNFKCVLCGYKSCRKDYILKHTSRHVKDQHREFRQSP